MVAGFVLFTGFMIWFFICAARYLVSAAMDETEFRAQCHSYMWAAKYGLGLCLLAWCWALCSSIALMRQSRDLSSKAP
jgi:hypothetical protein